MTGITEITGMEGDVITMQDIFLFERTGIGADGKVHGTLPGHRHPPEVQRHWRRPASSCGADMFEHTKLVA